MKEASPEANKVSALVKDQVIDSVLIPGISPKTANEITDSATMPDGVRINRRMIADRLFVLAREGRLQSELRSGERYFWKE